MEDSEKLKVLFLPAWYPHRGDPMLGLFVQRHAEAVNLYAEVTVLAVVSDPEAKELYEAETRRDKGFTELIIYHRKFQSKSKWLNTLVNGYRYLNAHLAGWKILEQTIGRPDINHVHVLTRAGLMALFFKIRHKTPYVITEHWSRYLPHHGGYGGGIHQKLTEKVVRKSAGISTVSEALKKGMTDRGLQHNHWPIIPNVVDTRRFQIPESKKGSRIRISHISCFEEQSKNMSGILRAAKALRERGIDFELLMIGNGPDKQQTEALAKKMNMENYVQFTGILEGEELVEVMGSCHFSVLFSHYETFAIVIPENLSMGIPVIATNTGGIPEVLPENFGKLVPPGDESALTDAMEYMCRHYQDYDAEAMHNYVEENFSIEETGRRFIEFYRQAIH
jgi:glycosyltransferase involved in cell wall biosynthesis